MPQRYLKEECSLSHERASLQFSHQADYHHWGLSWGGKTTLINRLLNQPELPSGTAVLVNDFGDINIDESLIQSESDNGNVIGLSNGCVCCSISDDLSQALDQLNTLPITQVILETSGVAEPARVWQHCHYPGFTESSRRGHRCGQLRSTQQRQIRGGTLVSAQTSQADLLVVSKSDLNPRFRFNGLIPQLSSQDAKLIGTIMGWQRDVDSPAATPQTGRSPEFSAQTWYQEEAVVPRPHLEASLHGLDTSVQRVKGWIETDEGFVQVDKVGEHLSVKRLTASDKPNLLGLVFIFHVTEKDGARGNPVAAWPVD